MPQAPHDVLSDLGMDRPALLAALRARVARRDRGGGAAGTVGPGDGVPLCDALDAALPGGRGLPRAAVHEVLAAEPGGADGFCALALARSGGTAVWIAGTLDALPSGLGRFGLSPAGLILVRAARPDDRLWAMENALRCPGVSGALLAADGLDAAATRRLQLAAEAGGAVGLLLRSDGDEGAGADRGAPTALTRWRVGALAGGGSGHGLGDPRWQLELPRGRGGAPKCWRVVWRGAAERLELDSDGEDAEGDAPPSRPASRPGARHR